MHRNLLSWAIFLTSIASAHGPTEAPHFVATEVKQANRQDAGPLSPGMLVSIYGSNLGPVKPCQAHPDPDLRETPHPDIPFPNLSVYPKELCGVRVLVDGQPAGMIYAQAEQTNFKVPMAVATEGTVKLQVIHGIRQSSIVQVPVGIETMKLSLSEPAYTDLPIWIDINIPAEWNINLRYPMGFAPGRLRCNQLEVRRGGNSLEPLAGSLVRTGVNSGPLCGGGSLDNSPENRLPLHVFFRLDQPGEYEVRFSLSQPPLRGTNPEVQQSAPSTGWTPIQISESPENQRSKWIARVTADPPTEAVEVVSSYLPDLLGIPDAQSLNAVLDQFYHPHQYVRRYAELALNYWPQDAQLEGAVQQKFGQRGPSEGIIHWLSARKRLHGLELEIVEPSIPYLLSDDHVLVQGALLAVSGYAATPELTQRPELASVVLNAMIEATNQPQLPSDGQTRMDFIQGFRNLADDRAAPILRRWVDEGIHVGSALSTIAGFGNTEDLPRIANLLTVEGRSKEYYRLLSDVPEALYASYGNAATPTLEHLLEHSEYRGLQVSSVLGLLHEDHLAAWRFALAEIENDGPRKSTLLTHINVLHAESQGTEASILELTRRRATRPTP